MGTTSIGPIRESRINQVICVGEMGVRTIQAAVNYAAQKGGSFIVTIPFGYAGGDTIAGVVNGSAAIMLSDLRGTNAQIYGWNGAAYVPASFTQKGVLSAANLLAVGPAIVSLPQSVRISSPPDAGYIDVFGINPSTQASLKLRVASSDGSLFAALVEMDASQFLCAVHVEAPYYQITGEAIRPLDASATLDFIPALARTRILSRSNDGALGQFEIAVASSDGAGLYKTLLVMDGALAQIELPVSITGDLDISGDSSFGGTLTATMVEVNTDLGVGGDASVGGLFRATSIAATDDLTAAHAEFDICLVDGSPVRTFANTPDGGGGGGGFPVQPTWGKTLIQFGDSITWGAQLGAPGNTNAPAIRGTQAYGALIAADLGLPNVIDPVTGNSITNLAIPGDTSADIFPRQIALSAFTKSTTSSRQLYTLAIGTNDVAFAGNTSYSPIFQALTEAALAWIAIPAEYSTIPGNPGFAPGGGGTVNPFPAGPALASGGDYRNLPVNSSMLAAVGNCTITQTTDGHPLYLFYVVGPSLTGTFVLTVDGNPEGTFNSHLATVSNNAPNIPSVAMVRVPVAAGVHTVAITGSTGTVQIIGTGTIPVKAFANRPSIAVVNIFPQNSSYTPVFPESVYAAYRVALQTGVNILKGDGADIRYVEIEDYVPGSDTNQFAPDGTGPGGANSDVHLGQLGHANTFHGISASLLASPAGAGTGGGEGTALTLTTTGAGPATLTGGDALNIPPPAYKEMYYFSNSGVISETAETVWAQMGAGQSLTLPSAIGTSISDTTASGPTRSVTIYNVGSNDLTMIATAPWAIVYGSAIVKAGEMAVMESYNAAGSHNWFRVNPAGTGGTDLTLTTTGAGPATLSAGALNIPPPAYKELYYFNNPGTISDTAETVWVQMSGPGLTITLPSAVNTSISDTTLSGPTRSVTIHNLGSNDFTMVAQGPWAIVSGSAIVKAGDKAIMESYNVGGSHNWFRVSPSYALLDAVNVGGLTTTGQFNLGPSAGPSAKSDGSNVIINATNGNSVFLNLSSGYRVVFGDGAGGDVGYIQTNGDVNFKGAVTLAAGVSRGNDIQLHTAQNLDGMKTAGVYFLAEGWSSGGPPTFALDPRNTILEVMGGSGVTSSASSGVVFQRLMSLIATNEFFQRAGSDQNGWAGWTKFTGVAG